MSRSHSVHGGEDLLTAHVSLQYGKHGRHTSESRLSLSCEPPHTTLWESRLIRILRLNEINPGQGSTWVINPSNQTANLNPINKYLLIPKNSAPMVWVLRGLFLLLMQESMKKINPHNFTLHLTNEVILWRHMYKTRKCND